MEEYISITRKGILSFRDESTNNQCTETGNELYVYNVNILFEKSTKLDGNGFVINHEEIDKAAQKVSLNSCELMSNNILDNIENVLSKKMIDFIGIKLRLESLLSIENTGAYFQQFRCKKKEMLSTIISM